MLLEEQTGTMTWLKAEAFDDGK